METHTNAWFHPDGFLVSEILPQELFPSWRLLQIHPFSVLASRLAHGSCSNAQGEFGYGICFKEPELKSAIERRAAKILVVELRLPISILIDVADTDRL
jgi:hypothetical protein